MSYEWIIVASPTIMDGLVLRWYASEEAALAVEPHVSASRNRVQVHIEGDLAQDAVPEAEHVFALLRDRWSYDANYERVKAMATHHHPMFSRELIPVAPASAILNDQHEGSSKA